VNSMREFAIPPDEAFRLVTENRSLLQRLLAMNIEAEKPKMAASAIAEMVLSFFSGLCIESNLKSVKTSSNPRSTTLSRPFEVFNWTLTIWHASLKT